MNKNVEILAHLRKRGGKYPDEFDFKGMAQDLAGKLSVANRNIDRLIELVSSITADVHVGLHGDDSWQDCHEEPCNTVRETLAKMGDQE